MTSLTDTELQEFIEYFGKENIPNPDQYPRRFEFLVKIFCHHKTMKELKNKTGIL